MPKSVVLCLNVKNQTWAPDWREGGYRFMQETWDPATGQVERAVVQKLPEQNRIRIHKLPSRQDEPGKPPGLTLSA